VNAGSPRIQFEGLEKSVCAMGFLQNVSPIYGELDMMTYCADIQIVGVNE
jgi:hypothetical protein